MRFSAKWALSMMCGVPALAGAAWGCEGEDEVTSAQVKNWYVSSSEVPGAQDRTSRRWPHFKLPHLLDGDSKTPWVFRGQGQKNVFEPTWGSRFALSLEATKPVVLDEIRLMNGYNKRPDLFYRNDRVVQVGIAINGKKVKTAFLSDKMGWHAVSIPRQKVETMVIEFVGVRKGKGPDNDVCLSELAFFNRGRAIS